MSQLIIIGAGGHGREMLWVARRCGIDVAGFLVDGKHHQGDTVDGINIIGETHDWPAHQSARFIIAIGSPAARRRVCNTMKALGSPDFATLIDPSAIVSPDARIGAGTMISPGAVISVSTELGQHTLINTNAQISHDARGGDFVTLAPSVVVCGNVSLGDGVELGARSVVREKLAIGAGSMAAMGAVVTTDVSASVLVGGCPATVMRTLAPWDTAD